MLRRAGLTIAVLLVAICFAALQAQRTTAADLAPSAIYAAVSPAIAYIETPIASGSGVLIDDQHVLTNAHVAWPFETVRVRFPDGTDFKDATVVAWDSMADFAVIRIPPIRISPVQVGDAQDLSIGSDVYLIGYPGEIEKNPQPTIVRGILSRFRTGGPAKLTYIQSDAPATPGNSGGALISASGEFVGIPEFRFGDTTFTLAAPAAQAVERARMLLRDARPDTLGDRRLSALAGLPATSSSITLDHFAAEQAFLVRTATDRTIYVAVNDPFATLVVIAPNGEPIERDVFPGNATRSVTFLAEAGRPYVIVLRQADVVPHTFAVNAVEPLLPIQDRDSGAVLTPGRPVTGNIDFMGNHDYYYVDLVAGQTITVTASSVAIDPFLNIDRADNPGSPLATDDDTGGGLLGRDARATYTASAAGRYIIGVGDRVDSAQGGYAVAVYSSAPPASAAGARTIVSGVVGRATPEQFVFGGGTNEDLVAAARCAGGSLAFWAAADAGQFVSYLPGAAEVVNAAWNALFPFGLPAGTSLWGRCIAS